MFGHSELLKRLDLLVGGAKNRLLSCMLGAAASLLALFLAMQSGMLVALLSHPNEISAACLPLLCMLLTVLLCVFAFWKAKCLCHNAESETAHTLRRKLLEHTLSSDSTSPMLETNLKTLLEIYRLHLRFASCAPLAAGALILMLNISIGAAVAVMLVAPLLLFISHRIARYADLLEPRCQKACKDFSAMSLKALSQSASILACGQENYTLKRFDKLSEGVKNASVQSGTLRMLQIAFASFASILLCVVAVCIGALSALTDYISAADLFTLFLLSSLLAAALKGIYTSLASSKPVSDCAKRILAVLDSSDAPSDTEDCYDLIRTDGHVLFQEVALHHEGRPTLERTDFEIAAGSRVGIIDPKGDLREALFRMLLRQWDVDEGIISISGKDVRRITKQSLRRCCILLDENVWIKTGTVAENIALARPDAKRKDILAAAKFAQAHDFICRMPLGYDTPIGNNGFPLSESEKQLIGVARFLLTPSSMLLWNDAASAVDARTEFKLQAILSRIMNGHTSFIATSRTRTLENSDAMLLMNMNTITIQKRSIAFSHSDESAFTSSHVEF